MSYLLDTSVFSQPLKKLPNLKTLERWEREGDSRCQTSIVVVSEILWGIKAAESDRLRHGYHTLLEDRLDVLPTDESVWHQFATMKARQRKIGELVGDLDLLISATAKIHRLTIATLNHRDFSRIEGIAWEDWGI